jgi:hypothetical protein
MLLKVWEDTWRIIQGVTRYCFPEEIVVQNVSWPKIAKETRAKIEGFIKMYSSKKKRRVSRKFNSTAI